ncbi:MAG: hypothetical protein FWD17_07450, partial [Polyangiaceae bacterium]|nr:hypothetical protein [Polyangiaceae bacterium]
MQESLSRSPHAARIALIIIFRGARAATTGSSTNDGSLPPTLGHTRPTTLRARPHWVPLAGLFIATQTGCESITGLAKLEKDDCADGCDAAPGAVTLDGIDAAAPNAAEADGDVDGAEAIDAPVGTGDACRGADIASDPDNCGTCGHRCLGGKCGNAACQPVALASSQDGPLGIAVDSSDVYWTDQSGGSVMRVSIGGGMAVTLMGGQASPAGIAVDSAYAYYALEVPHGSVMRIPLAGGVADPVASGQDSPYGVAVDAQRVYWTNAASGGAVMS